MPTVASEEAKTLATTDDITTAINNIDTSNFATLNGTETLKNKTLKAINWFMMNAVSYQSLMLESARFSE